MLSRTEVSTFRKPSSSFHFALPLTVVAVALLMQGAAHAETSTLIQNAAQAAFARQANAQITTSSTSVSTTATATSEATADEDNKLETTADGTVMAWVPIARDYSSGYVSGTQDVRYGAGNRWIRKTVTGSFSCSQSAFGGNPAPNWTRVCEVRVAVPAPQPVPANSPNVGPEIDTQQTWYGFVGYTDDRTAATSELPAMAGRSGAFRILCEPSHMAFDDPLVYPGQPGKSHLHTFFGNTGTNAYSTASSVATTGGSTCKGGILDRSAYWVPTMIDTKKNKPLRPMASMIYYKNGFWGIDPKSLQDMPTGLRMIAGRSSNSSPSGPFVYRCLGGATNGKSGMSILDCEKGTTLRMEVHFPECWDGKNLDSPDHMSHMTYRSGSTCPASHPVPVARVSYLIDYPVLTGNIARRWRLASDMYDKSLPGGYSAHGDFVNGWDPEAMHTFMSDCNRAAADCHTHLLGNYKRMY